jgi:toxin YoeB
VKLRLTPAAAEDLTYWQASDADMARTVERLLQQLPLMSLFPRHRVTPLLLPNMQLLSVTISLEHRLVFECHGDEIIVHQCRYHY